MPRKPLSVDDAILQRRSIRAFKDTPVDNDTLREILAVARYAPSGGNLQPWHVYVLNGVPMQRFLETMATKVPDAPMGGPSEYNVYPPDLKQPYRARRSRVGAMMYELIGVAREDRPGKLKHYARNYEFFDAPAAMFFSLDRSMEPGQWSDLGMFIQSIMLLAESRGLATCAQESWASWYEVVQAFCDMPADEMLFCGLAIGYADSDAPINALRTERAEVDDFTRWLA
ncbi:MAG: nitroreductase [Pseudomonadota bacterium]